MIITDPLPLSSAPLDGTPVRLFVFAGSVIASFWSEERSREAFGPGDYREGWYLIDDDVVELDDPMGWEPLSLTAEEELSGELPALMPQAPPPDHQEAAVAPTTKQAHSAP
jgi:hypothetical protein